MYSLTETLKLVATEKTGMPYSEVRVRNQVFYIDGYQCTSLYETVEINNSEVCVCVCCVRVSLFLDCVYCYTVAGIQLNAALRPFLMINTYLITLKNPPCNFFSGLIYLHILFTV